MNYQEKLEAVSLGQNVVIEGLPYFFRIMSIWEKSPSVHEVSLLADTIGSVSIRFVKLAELHPGTYKKEIIWTVGHSDLKYEG